MTGKTDTPADQTVARKTSLLSAGRDPAKQSGAVNPPVYRASTIVFRDADHWMDWEEMETIPGRDSLSMGRRGDPPPGGHVMMPLTRWTLGYTKSNQEWAPTVGEIVHLDWSCCGMTNPKAILVNEWAVAQMNWCSKCRNKVGTIFGPVGLHFDDSNPHQPNHGYIGRVQRVD